MADHRFSKDTLVHLYRAQKEAGDLGKNLTDLFVAEWQPGAGNAHATAGTIWNRKDDASRDAAAGADICWDSNGGTVPLGLLDMTDAEKEVLWLCESLESPPTYARLTKGRSSSPPRSTPQ